MDEIKNEITGKTKACFEPALDYVVVKFPKWPFDKFVYATRKLGTQMKATGEVMAIGRNIEESLLKACRSLEIGVYHNEMLDLAEKSDDQLIEKIVKAQDDRLFYVSEAIRRGFSIEEIAELTKMKAGLEKLVSSCHGDDSPDCPILDELAQSGTHCCHQDGYVPTTGGPMGCLPVKSEHKYRHALHLNAPYCHLSGYQGIAPMHLWR